MKIVFSSHAHREFAEAADYLIEQNPTIARWFADVVESALEDLCHYPELGRPTDDPAVRVLTLAKFPYRIFYEVTIDEIRILSIFHTARDTK